MVHAAAVRVARVGERVNVIVNGDTRQVDNGITVRDLLHQLGIDPDARGIAVARNGDVVIRSQWSEQQLSDADSLEVLHAVQGG